MYGWPGNVRLDDEVWHSSIKNSNSHNRAAERAIRSVMA
jgi:hypothetical protein